MNKHQEMEIMICEEVTAKLRAAKPTPKTVISNCNEACKKIAEEKNIRYYLTGASTNLLFYEDNHCVKVDFNSNPQVQAIEISEDLVKHMAGMGGIHFD